MLEVTLLVAAARAAMDGVVEEMMVVGVQVEAVHADLRGRIRLANQAHSPDLVERSPDKLLVGTTPQVVVDTYVPQLVS
jgi:hypothetical protein